MKSVFEVPRQSKGLGSSGFRTMCGLCDISHKPSSRPQRTRNTVTSTRGALPYPSCAPPSPAAHKSITIHATCDGSAGTAVPADPQPKGRICMVAFTVNGTRREVGVDADTPLLWVLREHLETDRHQVRLRHRRLRRLHGAYRWRRRCAPASRRCRWSRASRSPPSRGSRPTAAIRCRRPGSPSRCRNAATASPARSCRRPTLLARNKAPTREDIVEHMDGNICRCGTYLKIISAIQRAAREG